MPPVARITSPMRVRASAQAASTVTAIEAYTRGSWPNATGPMNGRSVSTGIRTFGSLTPGRPVKFSPIIPASPSPNRVSASPVATWLVTSVWVR